MRKISPRVALAVALLVGVTAFAAVAFAPAADAWVSACLGVTYYYSDATYTEVVGAEGVGCCDEEIDWGIVTPYSKCERLYCLDVQCPQ